MRYSWLKFNKDFFNLPKIKKIKQLPGGDTYLLTYIHLMCLSVEDDGSLYYQGIEPTFAEELALMTNEPVNHIRGALTVLQKLRLIEQISETHYVLPEAEKAIGSECASAERVRRHRRKKEQELLSKANNSNLINNTNQNVTQIEGKSSARKYNKKTRTLKRQKGKLAGKDGETTGFISENLQLPAGNAQNVNDVHNSVGNRDEWGNDNTSQVIKSCKFENVNSNNFEVDDREFLKNRPGRSPSNQPFSQALHCNVDKIREDKKNIIQTKRVPLHVDKGADRELATQIPTLNEVKNYIALKDYHYVSADEFYAFYTVRNWTTTKGRPITNWKASVTNWNNWSKQRQIKELTERVEKEKARREELQAQQRALQHQRDELLSQDKKNSQRGSHELSKGYSRAGDEDKQPIPHETLSQPQEGGASTQGNTLHLDDEKNALRGFYRLTEGSDDEEMEALRLEEEQRKWVKQKLAKYCRKTLKDEEGEKHD